MTVKHDYRFFEEVYYRMWIYKCVTPQENQRAADDELVRIMKEVEEEWGA